MENCLVTKLKSVVDNDALEVLGYLSVVYDATGDSMYRHDIHINVVAASTGSVKVVARKGIIKANAQTDLPSPQIVLANSSATYHFTPGIVSIYDIQKETLKSLSGYGVTLKKLHNLPYLVNISNIPVDNLDIKNVPMLNSIIIKGSTITGDIKKLLLNCPNLTSIEITECANITGDISEFGILTGLTTLKLGGSDIEGSVEDFVARQKISGNPSNTTGIDISWLGAGTGIKYIDSKEAISQNNLILTWETSGANTTININDNITVIAIASDGTWTRVS